MTNFLKFLEIDGGIFPSDVTVRDACNWGSYKSGQLNVEYKCVAYHVYCFANCLALANKL